MFILLTLAGCFLLYVMGRWILGPLDDAARSKRHPAQFTMIDFLALMFLFQLPTGAIASFSFADYESGAVWVLYLFGWITVGLFWWTAVRTLSRAGIHNAWRRAAIVGVVLPVAVCGSIAGVVLTVTIVMSYLHGHFPASPATLISADLFTAVAVYVAGRYTRYAVASVAESPGQEEPRADAEL